jgi:hypothetical protein
MALTQVTGPYPIFTDLDGTPLDDGYLYIGAINEDPEQNPIQVFWDANLTIPATQPIRTNNGYAYRNGTPALIYTASQFSITIRNKREEFVLYSPVGYGFDPAAVSASVVKNDFNGDGIRVSFTLSSAPSTVLATNAFINGVYQEKDSYTLLGNVITFSVAPPVGSSIEIITNETGVINSGSATAISYTLTEPGATAQTVQTKLEQYISVKDFGAVGNGVADDTAAIQAAMDVGGLVWFPAGTYKITAPLTRSTTGLMLVGAGIDATIIIAASTFTGDSMFTLGNKDGTDECRQISMRDILVNCDGNVDCGVELYGLRDGSTFESVYIWKIRQYGLRTGWTNTGVGAPGTMNQGLLFNNVQVLGENGSPVNNGAYYDLSGLYESTFVNCKALGYDTSVHTNVDGWRIGGVATGGLGNPDSQGVRLINCSVGNLYGTGIRGVFFGSTFWSSADAMTCENVEGTTFSFEQATNTGTPSDQYSPAYCSAVAPRMYNPAVDTGVNAVWFSFDDAAAQCTVSNVGNLNPLSGQKLARFLGSAALCSVEFIGGNLAPTSVASYIDFSVLDYTNYVRITNGTGTTSTTKTAALYSLQGYYLDQMSNGTLIEHTQFYTDIKLAEELRISRSDGTRVATIDATTGSFAFNKTIMPTTAVGVTGQVWYDPTAGNALKVI